MSKNPYQAEIDSACELIDFWRFNPYFMTQVYDDQPLSTKDVLNYMEHRPLEGFVFALSPFNFTLMADGGAFVKTWSLEKDSKHGELLVTMAFYNVKVGNENRMFGIYSSKIALIVRG